MSIEGPSGLGISKLDSWKNPRPKDKRGDFSERFCGPCMAVVLCDCGSWEISPCHRFPFVIFAVRGRKNTMLSSNSSWMTKLTQTRTLQKNAERHLGHGLCMLPAQTVQKRRQMKLYM